REVKKCLVKVLFYVNMNKQSQCGQTAREQANSGRATRKGIAWPAANKLDSVFLHCLLTATACFHLFFGLLHFLLPASFPFVSRLSVVMFDGQVLAAAPVPIDASSSPRVEFTIKNAAHQQKQNWQLETNGMNKF